MVFINTNKYIINLLHKPLCYTFFWSQMDMESNLESDSYSYLEDYSDDYSPKEVDYEIPELMFLPDNPLINILLAIEKEESSKLSVEQVDNNLWQDRVENMFRTILEKQINKLIEYHLPKELMDQVLVLKEDFKKHVCTSDLEERLYYICKQICELDTQYNS